MTYSQQSFSPGEVVTSAQVNQIEFNVRDHLHGTGNISSHISASYYGRGSDVTTLNHVSSLHLIKLMHFTRYENGLSVTNHQLSADNAGHYRIFGQISVIQQAKNFNLEIQAVLNSDVTATFTQRHQRCYDTLGFFSYDFEGLVYLDGVSDYVTFYLTNVPSNSVIQYHVGNCYLDALRF